jgi:hypothetical protein
MKTKTLENGTVLEVGKKYISEKWSGFIEILHLGNLGAYYATDISNESSTDWERLEEWNLQPYQEPKKMVKLYKYAWFCYASNIWKQSLFYAKDDNELRERNNSDKFIRLDYTMIEVEDYE